MKNTIVSLFAITLIMSGLASCSSGCVDCTKVTNDDAPKRKVCKTDYEADYPDTDVSWDTYRNALVSAGCEAE